MYVFCFVCLFVFVIGKFRFKAACTCGPLMLHLILVSDRNDFEHLQAVINDRQTCLGK